MLLLHISDIHFRAPQCTQPDTDPDRNIRTLLMRHLQERLAVLGRVDAILVGGDVAFKASPIEYGVARAWLLELARACGCSKDRIFVIPGNHDVDRTAIEGNRATRNVHHAIASAAQEWRDKALRDQLGFDQTAHDLLIGHAAYNDFAKWFNCQIYPGRVSWKQDVYIREGIALRIHGLTSTLLCGKDGVDEKKGALFLGDIQTAIDPVPDVVNLVMCHHPVDWLIDCDKAEEAINQRAIVQLFGHKHRQRLFLTSTMVQSHAGAVNPDRGAGQYEPGYSLIGLDVVGSGPERALQVRCHLFGYQPRPERFVAIRTSADLEVFETTIAFPADVLPSFAPEGPVPPSAPTAVPDVLGSSGNEHVMLGPPRLLDRDEAEAAMGNERTRNTVARFWDLSGSDRRTLALELGLIVPQEIGLPEPERYGKALIRARERSLIDVLSSRIAEIEAG